MRNDPLHVALLTSCVLHFAAIMVASTVLQQTHLHSEQFFPISLASVQQIDETPRRKEATPRPTKSPPIAPVWTEAAKPEQSTPRFDVPVKEEPAKSVEAKSSAPAKPEIAPSVAPVARVEGGGGEAGAGNFLSKGEERVVPGSGTGGGGGTATGGLGRGSVSPGLPAQTTPLRTNREAKPIQTVRATYPPMALRMGMESDVTLRVEIDTEGRVTKAEITKSGGAGFDDEALKAVKQARFEPAQKDGKSVAAEFTYIYRFRLQR